MPEPIPALTVGELRKLIENLPDDVTVHAYEGEGTGLRLEQGDKEGWITTDPSPLAYANGHDLRAWGQ